MDFLFTGLRLWLLPTPGYVHRGPSFTLLHLPYWRSPVHSCLLTHTAGFLSIWTPPLPFGLSQPISNFSHVWLASSLQLDSDTSWQVVPFQRYPPHFRQPLEPQTRPPLHMDNFLLILFRWLPTADFPFLPLVGFDSLHCSLMTCSCCPRQAVSPSRCVTCLPDFRALRLNYLGRK